MSLTDFADLLNDGPFNGIEVNEEKLREEHPALKDAWEKYQIILKMVEHT